AQHNLAATGSALLQVDAAAEFRNITVADNHVDGSLMAAQPGNVIRAYNTIIWGNQYSALGAQPAFSLVQGVSGPGAYLSAQPPGFRDPANGDYRLDSGSPAIDAGNDGYIMPNLEDQDHDGTPDMVGTDLDGNPRLMDDATVVDTGTSANAWPVVDLGAYERQLDSVAVGITVTQGAGLETSEAGATASFSLALNRYPGATVRVAVSSNDLTEGTVSPAYLEFTQADWNLPHVVTVTGVADSVIDGDVAYTVVIDAATSADAAYLGINPPDVDVINRDVLPTYRIGGSVTGLLGAGLTLQLSGPGLVTPETLAISANQPFTFAAMLASGVVYTVTASAQPGNPTQYCSIVNGSGTVGLADVSNIVVNCGAATTHRIGGTVSGLATGQAVVLQLNGGGDLTLTANGSYHFASQLEAGASFVVTVRSQPEGQLCTLSNASGTMAATDVDNVQVDCAPLLAELHLAVDDGYAYSRYGQVRDYFVTLSNTGNTAATNVAVSAQFSAAFDGGNVAWQCLGGGPGASCTAQGNGGFFDQASVPANSSVMWLVSVPVLAGSNAATATLTIGSPPPASAYALPANVSDSNTLVIFRDGLDVPYADGTQARADADLLAALGTDTGSASIAVPAATAEGLDVLRRVTVGAGRVEVQRLTRGTQSWVRLLRRDPNGQEHAGRWSALAPDARLVLGSLPLDAERRLLLLEGAAQPASLPLPTP
ncbi:MAG TPA: hypothetical protein VFN09_05565, partial [Rhodanobacteraceae bacterium]|nr:hypothetical protein [Rhodanobacteraceae bacterium]